jgi:hypothetical protein
VKRRVWERGWQREW